MTLPGTSLSHQILDPWPNTARSCPRCGGCYRKRRYLDASVRRRHHHVCDICGARSSDPSTRAIAIERSRCHVCVPYPRLDDSLMSEVDE